MSHTKSNRRDFMKTSAAIAGATAVPYVWTSSYAKAQSANDKLGIACIGVGGRGSGIGGGACGKGIKMAVCDVDENHAKRFAGNDSNVNIYKDYRKLFEKEKAVDVVTIGTPDHWHVPVAIAALKAGKDVYCEKPLTLTIDEGKQICKVVKETKQIFQVGTQQRSDRRFLTAIAMARSGVLGKTLTATCSIGGGPGGGPWEPTDPPAHLDWDFWLGQTPKVPYTAQRCHGSFRWWLEYSGGKLTDWGAHHVDIAQWGLGYEHSGPIEIEGSGQFPNIPDDFRPVDFFAGKQQIPNGFNSASTFSVTLKFDNGSKMIVQHGPGNGILFEGEKEHIFVNRGSLKGNLAENMPADLKEKIDAELPKLYKGMPFSGHMGNFFDCVRERKEPVSDVFTHHRELSSCHMCNIAMLLKRKLKWDPAKEVFIGDDEANALLSRPQRSPYQFSA